ncbi:DNA methyltransferase [Chloroflexota bacterium]
MPHLSENSNPLSVKNIQVNNFEELINYIPNIKDVCVFVLPFAGNIAESRINLQGAPIVIREAISKLQNSATFIILGEIIDLTKIAIEIPKEHYHHLIAIERLYPLEDGYRCLPNNHFGVLVYSKYKGSLNHTKTRIGYSYCPTCDKTTKDYGGKKHTYHEFGTSISDVWRDIKVNPVEDINTILDRFADLFGVAEYTEMIVVSVDFLIREEESKRIKVDKTTNSIPEKEVNKIIQGDSLAQLKKLPDNSVDFIFTDPPYNLGKKYQGYSDDLEIQEYFSWCDEWLNELARILKPGRTLSILNIPLWSIRHFKHLDTILYFQNWIVWDALAFPVRKIMPAHYSILCFTKGESRELPGFVEKAKLTKAPGAPIAFDALQPLGQGYCLRTSCVKNRKSKSIDDRERLTDLWSDIHRLKHNSRRVDHPTQLPPHLMYRLISIFTKPEEIILDCFNGAGTTTLTADQLGRKYIGIELEEKYVQIANNRHIEISGGINPFRKKVRKLNSKNSPVPRLRKQKYEVPKKTLQLEVKRVAKKIGHIPDRDEMIVHGKYPIEYYDSYFISWGEVTAAARTTGMSENRENNQLDHENNDDPQLRLGI